MQLSAGGRWRDAWLDPRADLATGQLAAHAGYLSIGRERELRKAYGTDKRRSGHYFNVLVVGTSATAGYHTVHESRLKRLDAKGQKQARRAAVIRRTKR